MFKTCVFHIVKRTRNNVIFRSCGLNVCWTFGVKRVDISMTWNVSNSQLISTSTTNCSFWEEDPKGGYKQDVKVPRAELIRGGLQELKREVELWKDEVKEKFSLDPILLYRPGEVDIMWQFDRPECLDQWVLTSDQDHGEGFSTCQLKQTSGAKGLFSGVLSTKVPKDGRIKKAGYCNMRTHRARKSFKREAYYDWRMYTHLVLRIRGDGRSYLLNLATTGYFDILWNDMYNYILYTRGGPYWQIAKIPFSKFFLSSKGRVQDKQCPIPLEQIASFGISAGEKTDGPFHLEIDYIGLEFDPNHREEFAYEMYKVDKYIAGH